MTFAFYYFRRLFKTVFARWFTVIEFCHDCGVRQPVVWTADDELWCDVANEPEGGGVLCPACFDRRAQEKCIFLRWIPKPE